MSLCDGFTGVATLLLVCTEATTMEEPVARLKVTFGVVKGGGVVEGLGTLSLTLLVVATEMTIPGPCVEEDGAGLGVVELVFVETDTVTLVFVSGSFTLISSPSRSSSS